MDVEARRFENREIMELTKKYRPSTFKQVFGQDKAVKVLTGYLKHKNTPKLLLFYGPPGCGKTTLARIMAAKLECHDNDLTEMNCALIEKPLNAARDIQNQMGFMPMSGKCRVWIMDEVQSFSRAKFAQQSLLKIFEEPPQHVYFMLATTDPSKLISPIRNRASAVTISLLKEPSMRELIKSVSQKEKMKLTEEAEDFIVSAAEGSPRQALVMLDSIKGVGGDDQLESLSKVQLQHQAIEVARILFRPKFSWNAMAKVLSDVDEEPESVRRLVLAYANSILLKGGRMANRADLVIQMFSDPYYDVGEAGLTSSCWAVFTAIHGKD